LPAQCGSSLRPNTASASPGGCRGQASRTYQRRKRISVSSSLLCGYDEPEILRSSSYQICLTGAEAGHLIQKGKLQVDFYTEAERYLESRALCAGDIILLCSGAHGFHVLEPVEMFEIKQGPYAGENDKTRFPEAAPSEIRIQGPGL